MKKHVLIGAALISAGMGSQAAFASTTFTYTPGGANDTVKGFSFTTSLDGAALANLLNADITATIAPFVFNFDTTVFPPDQLGFPIGGPFGSPYFHTNPSAIVKIGTTALGEITSWDISENVFVSWPAFPGEDPTDFFGIYSVATTTTGNTITLLQDNDAGLAPLITGTGAGSFGAVTNPVPEPATWAMMLFGFGAIGLAMRRRRQKPQVRFAF